MKIKYIFELFLAIFLLNVTAIEHASVVYIHEPVNYRYGFKGVKVTLAVDDQQVGFLTYIKIPLIPCFILYDGYIVLSARGKGYFRMLGLKVLYEIEKTAPLGKVYMFTQPGAFELKDGKNWVAIDEVERQKRTALLAAIYHRYGFHTVNSTVAIGFLRVLYYLLGIHEDPKLFMIRRS